MYEDYLKPIRKALADDQRARQGFTESFTGARARNMVNLKAFNEEVPERRLLPSLADLADVLGFQPDFSQQLGLHPDFARLKHTEETENHYIVSVFVDIRKSTQLYDFYLPSTVFIINNTIQRAAIHTALLFGGYVQRLQGDGLFVYFGGKRFTINEAVKRALQFAGVYSYFVKNDLKKVFEGQGIEDIYTRIGIDLGYNDDVIWAMAGIGEISEITTYSLHTNLASKMQQHATNNGVVVGEHIRKEMPLLDDFFSPVCLRKRDETVRYIFRGTRSGLLYTQYDFEWEKFLKKQDFIATDLLGNIQLKKKHSPIVYANATGLTPIAVKNKPYANF